MEMRDDLISMGLIPRSLLRLLDRFEPIPRCLRRGYSFQEMRDAARLIIRQRQAAQRHYRYHTERLRFRINRPIGPDMSGSDDF